VWVALTCLLSWFAAPARGAEPDSLLPPGNADPWPEIAELPAGPSTGSRALRTVRDLGSDVWHVASSPARLGRRGALVLAAVGGATVLLVANDEALFHAVTRSRDEPPLRQLLDVGEAVAMPGTFERTLAWPALAYAVGTAMDFDGLQAVSGEFVASRLIAGGLGAGARPLIGRRPPADGRGPRSFGEGDRRPSFPSNATSTRFELATIVSHHAPATLVRIIAYGAATAGALEEIDAGAHWPSDVFLSAVSGTLIARSVIRRAERRKADEVWWYAAVGGHGMRLGCSMAY
jgi:membrane-associated phospholipid phosphatase